MSKPPAIGQDVIDWLEGQFSDSLDTVSPGTSEQMLQQLLRKQGERTVINHLKALVTRQERGNLRTVL